MSQREAIPLILVCVLLAILLFIAVRRKWIHDNTLQTLANISGIVALLIAIVAWLGTLPSSGNEQEEPEISSPGVTLTNPVAFNEDSASKTPIPIPTFTPTLTVTPTTEPTATFMPVPTATTATPTGTLDNQIIATNVQEVTVTANPVLYVRAQPSSSAQRVGELPCGAKVPVIGITADGQWWHIIYGGQEVFISTTYASEGGVCIPTPTTEPATPTTELTTPIPPTDTPVSPSNSDSSTFVCWTGDVSEPIPGLTGMYVHLQELRLEDRGFFGIYLVIRFQVRNETDQEVVWGFASRKAVAIFLDSPPADLGAGSTAIPAQISAPYEFEGGLSVKELTKSNCPTTVIVQNFDGQTADIRFVVN
jgi:hypothetical protein